MDFKLYVFLVLYAGVLISCGRVSNKNAEFDFFRSTLNESLVVLSVEKDRLLEKNGRVSTVLRKAIEQDIERTVEEARKNIKEDCDGGEFRISYDFSFATEKFVSYEKFTSYINCYASAVVVERNENLLDRESTILSIRLNESMANGIAVDWETVDEGCKNSPDETVVDFLVLGKDKVGIILKKNKICRTMVETPISDKLFKFAAFGGSGS